MITAAVLLLDSSPIINFCKAGFGPRLIETIANRGLITTTVQRELERKVGEFASIRPFLDRWPANQVTGLTAQQREGVIDLMNLFQLEGEHPRAHEGEFATYVKALELRNDGTAHIVVIDDGEGRKLVARARGLAWAGTVDLLFEMVSAGSLSRDDGGRVWRATFSNRSRWRAYEQELEAWLRGG